jgi:hypothetical protein
VPLTADIEYGGVSVGADDADRIFDDRGRIFDHDVVDKRVIANDQIALQTEQDSRVGNESRCDWRYHNVYGRGSVRSQFAQIANNSE